MGFIRGLKKGLPIGIGYTAVSFAFGVMAITGVTPLMAIIISFTNLTSSGQFAGVQMIFEGASYIEIGLTVLLINLRYSLMSISLSQKLKPGIPLWKKLIFGYAITDEVFAVAVCEDEDVSSSYMFGIMIFPVVGWTLGTAIGALGASIFSARLLEACSLALYAMFIAIIVPDAKKSKPVLFVILIAIALSCVFQYVPYINQIGLGFKVIISTVVASIIGTFAWPVYEKPKEVTNV